MFSLCHTDPASHGECVPQCKRTLPYREILSWQMLATREDTLRAYSSCCVSYRAYKVGEHIPQCKRTWLNPIRRFSRNLSDAREDTKAVLRSHRPRVTPSANGTSVSPSIGVICSHYTVILTQPATRRLGENLIKLQILHKLG